jgi:sodium-dependent dicarboxylate transporter 2/3/5
MLPATIACSYAFMFPVATPPNAIVFASGYIKMSDMAKTGLFANILGILLMPTWLLMFGVIIFDIDLNHFPEWAVLSSQTS